MKQDNYHEILFFYIRMHSGYLGANLRVIDNTGEKAKGDEADFLVFLKGGIHFQLIKDEDGYYFELIWDGGMDVKSAQDVIAVLMIYGHEPLKKYREYLKTSPP